MLGACGSESSRRETDASVSSAGDGRDADKDPTPPTPSNDDGNVPGGDGSIVSTDGSMSEHDASTLPRPPIDDRAGPGCEPSLPTGFCFRSDATDAVGAGRNVNIPAQDISVFEAPDGAIHVRAESTAMGFWDLYLGARSDTRMTVGIYEPVEYYSTRSDRAPTLLLSQADTNCQDLTGRFEVLEYEKKPEVGIVRFAATFEQHCNRSTRGVYGAINYQAHGAADQPLTSHRSIPLAGKVVRVVYDAQSHKAYGIDVVNRQIASITLADPGTAPSYTRVNQFPVDACVDTDRKSLFVVNRGSTIISEHALSDLRLTRELTWKGTTDGSQVRHFQIYCGSDKLFLVDADWYPALTVIEDLDSAEPRAVSHSEQVSHIVSLALDEAEHNLYALTSRSLLRFSLPDLALLDSIARTIELPRSPEQAPLLLDESRGLLFAKNRVLDHKNLTKLIFTLPGYSGSLSADEIVLAVDTKHGLLATRNYVYDLDTYDVIAPTLVTEFDQAFFDRDGLLWFVVSTEGVLKAQKLAR